MGLSYSTHERYERREDHSEDLGVDGKIILEWLLRKWGGKV
jgi:hypothetical protein